MNVHGNIIRHPSCMDGDAAAARWKSVMMRQRGEACCA